MRIRRTLKLGAVVAIAGAVFLPPVYERIRQTVRTGLKRGISGGLAVRDGVQAAAESTGASGEMVSGLLSTPATGIKQLAKQLAEETGHRWQGLVREVELERERKGEAEIKLASDVAGPVSPAQNADN